MSNAKTVSQLTWEDVDHWVEQGLLTPQQASAIRQYAEAAGSAAEQAKALPEQRGGLNLVSVAYYFGGFMILFAYTLYMGLQWERLGFSTQTSVSGGTILALWALGYFLRRVGFARAGDLLVFAGAGVVPLFVYSLQHLLGIWPSQNSYAYRDFYRIVAPAWVSIELASIVVAVVVLWRTRFPLNMLLIAFWWWFLSMDLTRMLAGSPDWTWGDREQTVSTLMGLAMLALGLFLQRRTRRDYSLWLYIFGHLIVLSHLGALTLSKEGVLGLIFLLVYLGFVVASVWLQRRVFLVFGALGCYIYGSYLAFRVFSGSMGFPIAMAVTGLLIVLSAVGYQRFARPWIEAHVRHYASTAEHLAA
jgi:LPXTG-motif cell wall-anchored protein